MLSCVLKACCLVFLRHVVCVEGMLLELPGPALSQMLEDEALLAGALEKALSALDKQLVPR